MPFRDGRLFVFFLLRNGPMRHGKGEANLLAANSNHMRLLDTTPGTLWVQVVRSMT